jgi:type IV pilus assembly protein PilA
MGETTTRGSVRAAGRFRVKSVRQWLDREEGLTLVELIVVLLIIAVLLAIAVPSYLGARGRADDAVAKANLRSGVLVAETYFANCGTYADSGPCADGLYHDFALVNAGTGSGSSAADAIGLRDSGDKALSPDVAVVASTAGKYCLSSTHNSSTTYWYEGPGGSLDTTDCTLLP